MGGGFRKAPERRAGPIEDLGGRKGRCCAKKGTKKRREPLFLVSGKGIVCIG